jgi:hypothetical protein
VGKALMMLGHERPAHRTPYAQHGWVVRHPNRISSANPLVRLVVYRTQPDAGVPASSAVTAIVVFGLAVRERFARGFCWLSDSDRDELLFAVLEIRSAVVATALAFPFRVTAMRPSQQPESELRPIAISINDKLRFFCFTDARTCAC